MRMALKILLTQGAFLLLLILVSLFCLLALPQNGQAQNRGLGPFGIRNVFPPYLGHLAIYHEQARALPARKVRFLYQYSITNTFINSESPAGNLKQIPNPITAADFNRGLNASDFPAQGLGNFLDMEMERHQFRLDYGLTDALELGVELAWVSLGGGSLDAIIIDVEQFFGGVNARRAHQERNRFGFYVIDDGKFILESNTPFTFKIQDPVFYGKWNLTKGGLFLPAISFRLAAKWAYDKSPDYPRKLISSGEHDFGYSIQISKQIGFITTHLEVGQIHLGTQVEAYEKKLFFQNIAVEYGTPHHALILQASHQQSLFSPRQPFARFSDYAVTNASQLLTTGYKYRGEQFTFNTGFVEDFNSQLNQSDIVIFVEWGWEW